MSTSESEPKKPVEESVPDQGAAIEHLKISKTSDTLSSTSTQTENLSPSPSKSGEPSVPTPPEQEENPSLSSTSTPTASVSYAPRVDRPRTLRWQLSYETEGNPDLDERLERELVEHLALFFGGDVDAAIEDMPFKFIKLRTKE